MQYVCILCNTRNYFVISDCAKGICFVRYKRRMEWNTSNSTWCRKSLTIRYNFYQEDEN